MGKTMHCTTVNGASVEAGRTRFNAAWPEVSPAWSDSPILSSCTLHTVPCFVVCALICLARFDSVVAHLSGT
jgi:hypothetical protein